jgi:hypothetical protein
MTQSEPYGAALNESVALVTAIEGFLAGQLFNFFRMTFAVGNSYT